MIDRYSADGKGKDMSVNLRGQYGFCGISNRDVEQMRTGILANCWGFGGKRSLV